MYRRLITPSLSTSPGPKSSHALYLQYNARSVFQGDDWVFLRPGAALYLVSRPLGDVSHGGWRLVPVFKFYCYNR